MRRRTLWLCALLGIATSGCRQVNDQVAKIKATLTAKIEALRHRGVPARPPAGPGAAPAAPAPAAPPPGRQAGPTRAGGPGRAGGGAMPPPAPPPGVPQRPAALRDVPYNSPDTGTIDPGMSEKDVYSHWGAPADVRRQGEYTYLFFPNGCEYTCGTADVVILQNGHVVDAVLRWPGHGYSGQSSSPAATQPRARHGGDTLVTKPPSSPDP